MWLKASCSLCYKLSEDTPLLLMIRPRSGTRQWVSREKYLLVPAVPVVEYMDFFGNLCQRLVAPAGDFAVETSVDVMTMVDPEPDPFAAFIEIPYLPDSVLSYLLPSRYCESDRFGQMARQITADQAPGYAQVARIVDWIGATFEYRPDSSPFPESAVEVNMKSYGVCRDLAHLGIALCRSISIPARMVAGYLYGLKPMDLHAWFEVYIGDRWHTFDPVMKNITDGRIAIAYGRDAADVAVYTQFGPPAEFTSIDVSVELLDSATSKPAND